MYHRALVLGIITSCLIVILAVGAGAWGVQRGLIQGPTGRVQLGQVEFMTFTGIEYSTTGSPRAYYTVWVGVAKESAPSLQSWRPLAWAHRLVRLRVPTSAVLMR